MTNNDILSGLNPPQRKAVETVNCPVLILAGPGSGKTRVITHRIAYLVNILGIRPYQIMAVTFTNKAAREMRERLSALSPDTVKDITLGTFHAICVKILRQEAENLGLNRDFSIYDADDQLKLVKEAIKNCGLDSKNYTPGSLLSKISHTKSRLLSPEESALQGGSYYDEIAAKVYSNYQQLLEKNNALDFDDILLKTLRSLSSRPDILKKYQQRYLHILVDEFQDTNLVQYELVKMFSALNCNLCVVGDPDQSIYSWRSADIRNILNFEKDFPESETIMLEQNYRSTACILDAAQSIIDSNQERKPKNLWTKNDTGEKLKVLEAYDQREEARIVIREIENLTDNLNTPLGDIAVLFRTNAQSRAIEEAFIRHGIKYRLAAGTKFYERREIKDVICYLKYIFNPHDYLSLLRIINIPPRNIGKNTIESLKRWAYSIGTSEGEALLSLKSFDKDDTNNAFTPRSFRLLKDFSSNIGELMEMAQEMRITELLDRVLERVNYKSYLLTQPDGEDRWQNVLELKSVAQQYNDYSPSEGISAFLESVSLVSDTDNLGDGREGATLITLHQAKGLEFPYIFIIGLEEGLLPHYRSMDDPWQMEEERRLCYVGITRAKKGVYLLRAFKRMLMGTTQSNPPSRFLKDLPDNIVTGNQYGKEKIRTAGFNLHHRSKNETGEKPYFLPGKSAPHKQVKESKAQNIIGLKAGNKVRHPQFGEGIVVSIKPVEGDQEVVIAFNGDQVVLKRILLSYARLEKL